MVEDGAPQRVSDVVHERLRGDILEGRLPPGAAMPSERTLSEQLGVNRHAVREALKRLQQAGLVRISQGGATRVLDWRESGGVEVLLSMLGGGGPAPPAEVVRSVLELRAVVGTDAARRFVERAGADAREQAAGMVARTAAALVGEDRAALEQRWAELWLQLVSGSDNLAYRMLLNTLVVAIAAFPDMANVLVPRDAELLADLATAIRDQDAERAAGLVARQLEADVQLLA